MIPILYKSDEVDFYDNGLGPLNDIYDVDVQEQRNGLFTLTASYPVSGRRYKDIEVGRIVLAKPNQNDDPQAFRIVHTELDISGYALTVEADHITYDLTHNLVKSVHLQGNGQNAMTHLQEATVAPHMFRFVSDLQHEGDSTLTMVNPMEAIAGTQGSILQIWGGELKRDNRTVSMLSRRGRNNFTSFRLGKNINGLKYTVDTANLVTRIVPSVQRPNGNENELIIGDIVDSKNVGNYPNYYMQHVDVADKIKIDENDSDDVIKGKINAYAKNWFTQSANSKIDLPEVTVEIDVTSLQDSADYQDKFKNLEAIELTDSVTVYVPEFGVNVQAVVNELHYDPVAERVTSIVIGTSKLSFADANSNTLKELGSSINKIRENAVTAIVSANGKNTNYYGTEEPAHPVEGDLWFKSVGDETYLMIFKDGRWQEWVSTKTQDIINKQVDDALASAKEYTDELNDRQASEAVAFQSEANAALSSAAAERKVFSNNAASMATSAATHADSMANSAAAYGKAQAASALSSANSALTTAKSDLTTAIEQEAEDRNKAVQTVNSQAQDYATQAKSDAIEAANTADGQVRKDFKVTTDALSSTISQNKSDAEGKISTAQSTATQALDGLKTKVSQTEYNTKTGQLQTDLTTATQTANQAKLDIASIKSEADSQSAQINDIVSDANGTKQTISDIQTEQGKQSGSIATLQSRADGFDATVTKVDNLAGGGVNLLQGTGTANGDISGGNGTFVKGGFNGYNAFKTNHAFNGRYINLYQALGRTNAKAGDWYTISVYVKADKQIDFGVLNVYRALGNVDASFNDGHLNAISINNNKPIGTQWQQYSWSFQINNISLQRQTTRIEYNHNTDDNWIYWAGWVLEKGQVAHGWSPAPEDLSSATAKAQLTADNAALNLSKYKKDADGRISKAQADITATANEVSTKVSQTDYDKKTGDLSTKVNTAQQTANSAVTTIGDYKTSNDKRVKETESAISQNAKDITSKVSQTDYDKTTGDLSGKYSIQQQTINGISQTVTELQAKANAQGQVNQLMNTEFAPDTQSWEDGSDASSPKPYLTGVDPNLNARLIGFKTGNTVNNTYARFLQWVSTGSDSPNISLSWKSFVSSDTTGKANIYLGFADNNGKIISSTQHSWINPGKGWGTYKWENISLPTGTRKIKVSFEATGGVTAAYMSRPMLVFGETIGDYVAGNYNNNSRVSALEVDLEGITGLVNDPKKGLSATAALAANGLSVATTARDKAVTAIQTAEGVQTKVEQMGGINLLTNTEFNPDLEGWAAESDTGSKDPYRSYWQPNIQATVVGFDTKNAPVSSFARFRQWVQLSSTAGTGHQISISWYSYTNQTNSYNNLWVRFYDNNDEKVGETVKKWADPSSANNWNVQNKWEGIDVPDTAVKLYVSFEAREGTGAYLGHPMLVMGSTIGDYVAGNYNNNNSLESIHTQLAGQVTTEIRDRKNGDESVVTQTTRLLDQRLSSVQEGYESAISQSANAIMASVSQPNQLLNTEFNPDLEGWNDESTAKTSSPYLAGTNNGPKSRVVGFDTLKEETNYVARLTQFINVGSNSSAISISWMSFVSEVSKYASMFLVSYDNSGKVLNYVSHSWVNSQMQWKTQKWENITLPAGTVKIKLSIEAREGTKAWIAKPMLVFGSTIGDAYMPGSYSGMNTSTVLELFKDNWALGITDNAGRIISGINGDLSGTVIQGKKLVINSDTTINGKAFIDGSVIKNASIGNAQIGNAAIGSAQIINVDVSKISGNIANFITANVDTLNARVLYGDTGHLGTTDTGRVINKQDNHLQLAARGFYDSTNDRAQLELLGNSDNSISDNMKGSLNYYGNPTDKGHGLGIRLKYNQILAIDEDGGSKNLYLSPYAGGQVRIVSRDLNSYYDIAAANFRVSSQRKFKSDIKPLDDGALDIVNKTNIKSYTKNGVSEIGVIADEAPSELLSDDGKFINIYDYTSVLYKAVQELSAQVKELQNERPNN